MDVGVGTDYVSPPRWSKEEILHLIEAWCEVEKGTTYASRLHEGSLDKQIWRRLSRRYRFERSTQAISHQRGGIRTAVRFICKFDAERQATGGRRWFDLSRQEKERLPISPKARWASLCLTREAFDMLAEMGGVDKYVKISNRRAATLSAYQGKRGYPGGRPLANQEPLSEPPVQDESDFQYFSGAGGSSPASEIGTASTEQEAEVAKTEQWSFPGLSTQKISLQEDRAYASTSEGDAFRLQRFSKDEHSGTVSVGDHRDCAILLERMMQLQSDKFRRTAPEFQAEIELALRQNTEVLRAEFADRCTDAQNDSDVTYVSSMLTLMERQISGHFDRFQQECDGYEDVNERLARQHLEKLGL